MRFRDKLREHLRDKLTPEELLKLPRGFQTIEDVIILNLKPELLPKKKIIAQTYLDLLPYIRSVWGKVFGQSKVVGKFRTPTGLEHLAGIPKREVIAKENGVLFKHDFTKIIFSKGNIRERSYLPTMVKDGELVLDMFAGIGYFSLMIAKLSKPEHIYACEINPVSFEYLVENIKLNGVKHLITPYLGDCAIIVPRLVKEINLKTDRIIMGVFPAPKEYLPVAFQAVKRGAGTVIHYEGKIRDKNIESLYNHVRDAVEKSSLVSTHELLSYRFVKNVGVNQQHAVLDILVK